MMVRAGYSLLEVLIVLAILGLMLAIAAPPFLRVAQQQRERAEWASVVQILAALPQQARQKQADLLLAPHAGRAAGRRPQAISPLSVPEIADLSGLPPGYVVTPLEDIWVRFDGVCLGGAVQVADAAGQRRTFRLEPPFCTPRAT